MTDTALRKYELVRELAELRWKINKLEEMKKKRSGKERLQGTEVELFNHSQSTQFFLGVGGSQAVKRKGEAGMENNNHTK